jgi:hypothetical protein
MAIDLGRRQFIAALGGTAVAQPPAVVAQQSERRCLVGLVSIFTEAEMRPLANAFRLCLKELGWDDARQITVDVRATSGSYDRRAVPSWPPSIDTRAPCPLYSRLSRSAISSLRARATTITLRTRRPVDPTRSRNQQT